MKKFLTILIVVLLIGGIIWGSIYAYKKFTNKEPNNSQKSPSTIKNTPIFTIDNYPKVDGSTATIPLSEAFKKNFTGDANASVTHATTHYAYLNLINGDADIILVTSPSEEELKIAKKKNVELEVIPVVNEAFTFYVNEENPVKNVTFEQLQKIYTGEITNWKELGGDDAKILAFQREPNSGSQTGMLDLVMKDKKIMAPPTENIIRDMASIVNLVSDYDNGKYSIGYSYYYYATTMYEDIDSDVTNRIAFLSINGVAPKNQTIIDGSYPIRTAYYIVINKNEPVDGPVRKLVDAMLSDRGQKVAEEIGYVPLR